MERETNIQMDRRQTNILNKEIAKHKHRFIDRFAIDGQTDTQTDRQTDKQTDRQTDKQTDRQTDRQSRTSYSSSSIST